MKILLLEDNITDADLTKRGLIGYIPDCIIEHASTLEQARKYLDTNLLFDIALLDVNLPDGNGIEFLMEIRQRELNFPVIVLTGSGDEEAAVSALKAGADDYIVKRLGYILHLPDIINSAITNFKENDLYKSEVINVLYIEHHTVDIDLTVRHFTQYAPFIQIDAVATAEEALLKLESSESYKHKVIVMDYRLPGMDALELIKTIRQNKKLCIPIILVTGQGNEELAVQALKLGANDYLTKSEKYLFKLPSVIVNSYQHCELKRKQDALAESESKYRLLADNSGDVIFVLDMDLNYTYISPAVKVLRGFEPEEAIKQKLSEASTPASYPKAVKVLSEILLGKSDSPENSDQQKSIELEMIRKDTTTVWTEVKASLITDKNNEPIGILGVSRDISERKKMIDELISAKEKAEESDKLKTAFLANISHEIRTPMNGILGFAELLKEEGLTGDQQREYIKIIEKSGQRMLNIINDIVDISKIESGLVELRISEININEQIEYACTFFKPEVDKKEIQLIHNTTFQKNEVILKTDREKLYAILLNLIKNAIKYTDCGKIEIGYNIKNTNHHSYIEFYIADTGIGIPSDRQKAIFERFIQADISDRQARQGAGLGLSITKAYVELMGGNIWVESEHGKGSIFYFTLPFSPESLTKNSEPGNITGSNNELYNKLKILIAEDDENAEQFLKIILRPISSELLIVRNGAEAVEVCKLNPDIDVVLMDIQMPIMNGYEATRQIRLFNEVVIIIAQTAFALSGEEEKVKNAGCNAYISKPINKANLISIIKKHINKQ